MSSWRDRANPFEVHTITFDGVRLEFGVQGVLQGATDAQVTTMTAGPLRRARFVEVDEPAPAKVPAPAAPIEAPIPKVQRPRATPLPTPTPTPTPDAGGES